MHGGWLTMGEEIGMQTEMRNWGSEPLFVGDACLTPQCNGVLFYQSSLATFLVFWFLLAMGQGADM